MIFLQKDVQYIQLLLKSTVICSLDQAQLSVVLTTPGDQLFNLLTVCRRITISDQADDCCAIAKLQVFDKSFFLVT